MPVRRYAVVTRTALMDSILVQDQEITVRRMQDDLQDYQLMAAWLTNEQVLKFYEGRDNPFPLERVIEHYSPRVLQQESTHPCILLHHDRPIGYLQYYALSDDDRQSYGGYGLGEDSVIYGIDLFIGETAYWNQGLGSKVLSAVLRYLFESLQADKVVIDPHIENTRAIRCYEKCGFVRVKQLPRHELHEGEYRDSWLMVSRRSTFQTTFQTQ